MSETHTGRERQLAVTVEAPGQCDDCRAWRPDGQPPTVHFRSCRHWRRDQNRVLRTGSGYVSAKGRRWSP